MTHPWHDIELPPDDRLDEFPVVVEIPRGSKVKYAIDERVGFLRVDRVLFSSMHYPANYGIIPRTLQPSESEPLDALVLGQEPIVPLAVLTARAIGGFRLRDESGSADRIMAVHVHDPAFNGFHRLRDLPAHVTQEIEHFFEDYAAHEGLPARLDARLGRDEACRVVRECAERYRRVRGT